MYMKHIVIMKLTMNSLNEVKWNSLSREYRDSKPTASQRIDLYVCILVTGCFELLYEILTVLTPSFVGDNEGGGNKRVKRTRKLPKFVF